MPNLQDMLGKARDEESKKTKPKVTKGIRPDKITRGEIRFGESGEIICSAPKAEGHALFPDPLVEQQPDSTCSEVESKLSQSEAKVEPELRPIHEPKLSQSKAKRKDSGAKVEPELRPIHEPKLSQSKAKVEPKFDLSIVVGLQRKLLEEIFSACRHTGSKTSPPFAIENLAHLTGTTVSAARKAIQRLEQKKLLARKEFKDGRGGWTKYELHDESYKNLIYSETRAKVEPKLGQTTAKVEPELRPELRPTSPSSSSSLRSIRELLTTGVPVPTEELALDDVWQKIDATLLTGIRFGQHQVVQIAREGKLSPEELQDSIYAFAFDLSENGKTKTITGAPLNYFMGILRRGPYAAPSNYESPAIRQKRLYLESKEQQKKKRLELEERLETVEFEEWLEKLPLDQRATVVPAKDFAKPGSTAHNYQMREYFRENVWPALKEKMNEL